MKSIPTKHCRLSGESLADADVLFDFASCPFPGIYPDSEADSIPLASPLRVVQAKESGFVQLADHYDPSMYSKYAFAGGGAAAYRKHLQWFAEQAADSFDKDASILEVGTGDGFLLERLVEQGFQDVRGIDPSRAAEKSTSPLVTHGFFPTDLPDPAKKFDLIVCRHVLEHIDAPQPFVDSMAGSLNDNGQLWIEVPDLDTNIERELWSNFYQLHCNYFNNATLDRLCAKSRLRCIGGEVVEIFGGSILRRYELGICEDLQQPMRLTAVPQQIAKYIDQLEILSQQLPSGAVGYGAAERTAVILGLGPSLLDRIGCLYDGNELLSGRYLAGTKLKIKAANTLYSEPPPAIVLFALSNRREILASWKGNLPDDTLVAIPAGDFSIRPLGELS